MDPWNQLHQLTPEPPPPMGITKLPQELHDAIVDHCHADRPTLKRCGAICRAWLSASRFHLFEKVLLHPHNVAAFLLLIRSPYCTFRSNLTALAVEQGATIYGSSASSEELWFNYGLHILAGFPSIRFLHIKHLGLLQRDVTSRLTVSLQSNFRAVKDLEIDAAQFTTLAQFASVIASFPLVERLTLDSLVVKDKRTVPQPEPAATLSRLTTLVFRAKDENGILDWFLAQHQLPPINTLHLVWTASSQESTVWNDFCTNLGPILEHLYLDNIATFNLAQNIGLRSIHIVRPNRPILGGDWITPIISSITSRHVQSIVFEAPNVPADLNNSILWSTLEFTLSKPLFDNLRKIEVLAPSATSAIFKKKLTSCESRGVLSSSSIPTKEKPFADFLRPIGKPPVVPPISRPDHPTAYGQQSMSSFVLLSGYAGYTIARYLITLIF